MDDDSIKLIARLQHGAARMGQSIDLVRFASDTEYAKTAILRFTDLSDDRAVARALDLIDRLGLAAAASTAAGQRGPVFRRELRPPRMTAPTIPTVARLDLTFADRAR